MRTIARSYGAQIGLLVVVTVALLVIYPSFANISSIFGSLGNFPSVGLVALGLGVTLIAGELDMSVASVATVSSIVAVQTALVAPASPIGVVISVAVPTIAGVLFGGLQGWAIAKLRINSLVFTIGTLILLQGFAYVISDSGPVSMSNYTISDLISVRWGIFSPTIVIAIVVFLFVGLFLGYVRFGRNIYAIGGSRNEAVAAGVPLRRTLVVTFAISAGCAALAGALVGLTDASATPLSFTDLLVQGISAVLIGGVSLYGGRGTVWNVVLGVAIVSVLGSGLASGGAQAYVATLITGVLLFLLIVAEFGRRVVAERSSLRRLRREYLP